MTSPGPGHDAATAAFQAALSEDNADDLYENAPCGYLSARPDGTIVKVNQTFLTLTGFSRDELVGTRTFQELLGVGDQIYYETHYGPLLQMQGEAREIAVDIVRADGRRLPVLVNSVVAMDDTGRPSWIRTAVFDATDRRAYERELLEARRQAQASEARARVLAETLQRSLLPPAAPEIPGLDVAAVYRPAGRGDEVGGDFYDVFETQEGDWVVVIGDVRGKGPEAAVVTALARHTLRAAAIRDPRPVPALQTLNEVLLRQEGDAYCTVAYARFLCRPDASCRVTVACGGHPLPLRVTPSAPPGSLGRPGTLLGLLDATELTDVSVSLDPGDAVVFFTDGVTEARGRDGFFGDERLSALLYDLRSETAGDMARSVVDAVVDFQNGDPRDDIAVVVARVPVERQVAPG